MQEVGIDPNHCFILRECHAFVELAADLPLELPHGRIAPLVVLQFVQSSARHTVLPEARVNAR